MCCKSRIFHMHVFFVYFVCCGFRTKIKMHAKGTKQVRESAAARDCIFYAYKRLESPGYEN